MKFLLIIFSFLCLFAYGQKSLKTPHELHMEKQSISKLNLNLNYQLNKMKLLTWRPHKIVKFTLKTRLNAGILNGGNLDYDDILIIGLYDIRCKIYMTKRLSSISRCFNSGIGQFFYSSGLVLKF